MNWRRCALLAWIWLFVIARERAAVIADRAVAAPPNAIADLAIIRTRYIASVLPTDSIQIDRLRDVGSKYANSLGSNGQWADVDYLGSVRANWGAAEHLNRTLVLAKMARLSTNEGRPNAALDAKVLHALQFWLDHDYRNPNWWWNEIGVPQVIGEIGTLILPELSQSERAKVVEIMRRSDWRKGRWTGANLTWGITIEIVRGGIQEDPVAVAEGYRRMYQEIKIVGPAEEGVQQDDSFHQHGPQLYNGGYGLNYANDVGRFVAFAWGTRFQISADKMAIFSSYLLNGEQWMVWREIFDYSAIGREITRKGLVALPHDWTVGPISPAGPAYSLGNTIALLAAEPTPRQREFRDFAGRLHGQPNAPDFTGNKQFWCSDFMVHRRAGYYTSVKMLSDRMLNGETVNGEGKKSEHLSDGVNFLYLTGDEYKDIFPVWDWTKLPGTTAIQGTLETGEQNPIGLRGKSAFAGGVSDGTYGMAAMDVNRGNLTAKKAWFFFDGSYLSLGAGIMETGDTEHSVATDVNQTRLHGAVVTSESKTPFKTGAVKFTASGPAWVYHDHVGYILASGSHVNLTAELQTGRWSDIGGGSDPLVTLPVFDLWIDHGKSPQEGTYQYEVLPGATAQETAYRASHPVIQVLANNEKIQAIWNGHLSLGMITFRQPGRLATPAGSVAVDHSCLLLLRRSGDSWKISAANPGNRALTLHISLGAQNTTIQLPDGNLAGLTVTETVRKTNAR